MKNLIYAILSIIVIIFIINIILKISKKFKKQKSSKSNNATNPNLNKNLYQSKQLLSDYEKYFYKILQDNFSDKYLIMPQVNLASIINKIKDFPTQYQNELYRNIDFGIFDKNSLEPLLLIEINDKTHNQANRINRDKKVKEICNIANIKLITFYSQYENKKDYVINRIQKELKKD